MSDDRDKLLHIMSSLEVDYKSGKISAEKYRYFRSKYEDKLNAIDARDATQRIRSMQGKASTPNTTKKSSKPARDKKKEEQDLVQKYIINPKKDDAKYNKKKKSSMNSTTFRVLAITVLVIAFTAGVAYGIFNLDTGPASNADVVAIVEDTAFPEISAVVNTTQLNDTSNVTYVEDTDDDKNNQEIETTTETTTQTTTDTQDSSQSNSRDSSSSSDSHTSSSDSHTSSSDSDSGSSSDSHTSSSDSDSGSSDGGGQ